MSKSSSTYNPETILGRLRGGSGDNTAADAHPRYTSQPQSRPYPQTKRARAFGADEDEELTCLRRHCEQLRDLLVRRVGTPHTESDNAYVRELEMVVETLQRENEWLAASLGNSRDASAAASASASTLPAPPAPPSRDSSSSVHHLRAGVKSARGRNGSMPWIHPDSRQGETAPPSLPPPAGALFFGTISSTDRHFTSKIRRIVTIFRRGRCSWATARRIPKSFIFPQMLGRWARAMIRRQNPDLSSISNDAQGAVRP